MSSLVFEKKELHSCLYPRPLCWVSAICKRVAMATALARKKRVLAQCDYLVACRMHRKAYRLRMVAQQIEKAYPNQIVFEWRSSPSDPHRRYYVLMIQSLRNVESHPFIGSAWIPTSSESSSRGSNRSEDSGESSSSSSTSESAFLRAIGLNDK